MVSVGVKTIFALILTTLLAAPFSFANETEPGLFSRCAQLLKVFQFRPAPPVVADKYRSISMLDGRLESDVSGHVRYLESPAPYEILFDSEKNTWRYRDGRPLIDGTYYY